VLFNWKPVPVKWHNGAAVQMLSCLLHVLPDRLYIMLTLD